MCCVRATCALHVCCALSHQKGHQMKRSCWKVSALSATSCRYCKYSYGSKTRSRQSPHAVCIREWNGGAIQSLILVFQDYTLQSTAGNTFSIRSRHYLRYAREWRVRVRRICTSSTCHIRSAARQSRLVLSAPCRWPALQRDLPDRRFLPGIQVRQLGRRTRSPERCPCLPVWRRRGWRFGSRRYHRQKETHKRPLVRRGPS